MKGELSASSGINELLDTFVVVRKMKPHYAGQFRTTLTWLRRALRRPVKILDLRIENLKAFRVTSIEMGLAPSYADKLIARLIKLWRFAAEQGLAAPCNMKQRTKFGPEPLPPPIGEPGTLLDLFWRRYMPETRINPLGVKHYFSTFRKLRDCFGRDLGIEEMASTATLATFRGHLESLKLKPLAARHHLTRIFAILRFCHREGLIAAVPYRPREQIGRDTPDAWTVAEFSRIVVAARKIERPAIGGVEAKKFWPALLLLAYYTALRRSTLLRLRPCDFDLDRAIVRVPGSMMKNHCGQVFRIGADAVIALRAIWDLGRERVFLVGENSEFLYDHFHAILKSADVAPNKSNRMSLFHKVRRTAVTLTAANAGLAEAIALAGHSGPEVNRRYIDPSMLPQHDATRWLPPPTGG